MSPSPVLGLSVWAYTPTAATGFLGPVVLCVDWVCIILRESELRFLCIWLFLDHFSTLFSITENVGFTSFTTLRSWRSL